MKIKRVRDAPGAAEAVGAVIGTSFHDLDVSAWIVPPEGDRRRVLPSFFSMFTAHAFTYGEVYVTEDMSGVAVWFHNDSPPLPEIPDLSDRLMTFAGPHVERLGLLGEEMEKRHPGDPHHYLAFLAVLPDRQGKGFGSALLNAYHSELDAMGRAAYLEASNTHSRRLYLRHGYHDLGEPLVLPDGPPMFPMWRPPNP